MTFLEGEIVALIIAIVTGVFYLVKISLQIQDYFNKIEKSLVNLKDSLREAYNILRKEQDSLRQEDSVLNKRINSLEKRIIYLNKVVAEIKPEAFKRTSDFDE